MRTINSPLALAAILLAGIASVATSQSPTTSPFPSTEAESPKNPSPLGWASPAGIATGRAAGIATGGAAGGTVQADHVGAAGDMIGFSHADGSGTQTITLVDTGKSWMAVYHIDRSGKIRLISSRPIDADFSLQLNATSPLPDEIRGIGKARR